jgi:hypothetical protein
MTGTDLVVRAGMVRTMDPGRPAATGLAVRAARLWRWRNGLANWTS